MMAVWRSPKALFAVVVLILIATAAAVLWQVERQQSAVAETALTRHAERHSALLAQTLAPLLADRQTHIIDRLIDLREAGTISAASVYDLRRELVAALEPTPGPAPEPVDEPQLTVNGGATVSVIRPVAAVGGAPVGLLQVAYPLSRPDWPLTPTLLAATGLVLALLLLALALWPLQHNLARLAEVLRRLQAGDWSVSAEAEGLSAPLADQLNQFIGDENQRRQKRKREAERRLQELQRLNKLLCDSQVVVWEADPQSGQFSYISEAAEPLLGHPLSAWLSAEFIGRYVHPNDREWLTDYFTQPGSDRESLSIDLRVENAAGEWRWLRMLSTVELHPQGSVPVGLLHDISNERYTEQQLVHLTDHDPLTNLYSRQRWRAVCRELINRQDSNSPGLAVVVIDLAQFQLLNELFGPDIGDTFLEQAAAELRALAPERSVLGRLGGDEFGLLLPSCDAESAVQAVAGLLNALADLQFEHDKQQVPFAANAGIALFPEHGFKSTELLARADCALRIAKRQGPGCQHLFDDGDTVKQAQTLTWAARLRRAVEQDHFKLLFQPLVDMRNGAIRYYDTALLWPDQAGKNADTDPDAAPLLQPPDAWQVSAELFGLNDAIDRWLVVNSLRYQHTSADPGNEPNLIVRFTGRHLAKPDILELLRDTARMYKLSPEMITVAVDVAEVGANLEQARTLIRLLHEMGQRFALDRFGSSGLSLAELQDLSLDLIRLDERLVRRLHWSTVNQSFVKATVEVARTLNVPVAAAGVGDEQTLSALRGLGVRLGQGDLFARPGPRFHELGRVVIAKSA